MFHSLTSGEYFKGLANLTELVVSLCHVPLVLQRVVSDGENAELLGNVRVTRIGSHTERTIVVFAHF